MLHSIKLNDQEYDELLTEALSRIPLYTNEWTNFNVSDPGITMLQNLSSFSLLQQSLIDEVTDELRLKLLKLLGITPMPVRAARLLVAPEQAAVRVLAMHEALMLGDLRFETRAPTVLLPWSIAGVYAAIGGTMRELTDPLRYAQHTSVQVLGAAPRAGDALLCLLEGPLEARMTLHFYVGIDNESRRNPFEQADEPVFAKLRWQYFTADGWADAACADQTHGFLTSGGIRLTLGAAEPAVCTELPQPGMAVRCLLEYADYDVAPRICALSGGLFEVEQRSTCAASFLLPGSGVVRIQSAMTRYENLFVFCREAADGWYFRYEADRGQGEGRFYRREDRPDGTVELRFDKARFGFAPDGGNEAVCAVCYDAETLNHYWIGTAYGYEDQVLDLTGMALVLPEDFSVLAELTLPDGQTAYRRIRPNDRREDSLQYEVLAAEGAIHIVHNGLGSAARLLLCDCAVTAGAAGNVRAGARLSAAPNPYFPEEARGPFYTAPGCGHGGRTAETIEQMRHRFIRMLHSRVSAVSERDYEQAVRTTPGLCIHKVRAVADEQNNVARITVKCYTDTDKQGLPNGYFAQIMRRMNAFRMISTRIELRAPQYVPIDVAAVIHVRNYYDNARTEIERLLRSELDYVSDEHSFGEVVRFTELYQKIERLECVDSIYSLTMLPRPGTDTVMRGSDILLGESCLCHLGTLSLELNRALPR